VSEENRIAGNMLQLKTLRFFISFQCNFCFYVDHRSI